MGAIIDGTIIIDNARCAAVSPRQGDALACEVEMIAAGTSGPVVRLVMRRDRARHLAETIERYLTATGGFPQ